MKLFGQLSELVKVLFKQNGFDISLDSNTSTTYTANRDTELPPGDVNSILVGQANTQTLTNKTIDADANTISNIENADIKAGAAIDATKIADGSVSNAEFQALNGVTGSLVTETGTQTLTNKSLVDANTFIIDDADATKRAQFQAASITTGTTRVLTIPDADLILVGTTTTQTLTNKSIDADTNTITNIEDADIKAAAAINATKIADGSVDNTEFQRLGTAGTAGAGNLVTTNGTQTLTNKVLDSDLVDNYLDFNEETAPATPAANTVRVYAKSDGKFYKKDDTGIEAELGGSGAGEKNYVINPDDANANWVVVGAGMSVATETSPSYLPEESKGTAIGLTINVASTAYLRTRFTIDDADKNKKLKIFLNYTNNCPENDDVTVEMYTNTASNYGGAYTQLQVQNVANLNVTTSNATSAIYSFDSTGADYFELRFKGNAPTVGSYVVMSGVVVGPGIIAQSAVVTGWESYTPTFFNLGTVTNINFKYRRVGNAMQLKGSFTAGTTGAADQLASLPTGLTVDGSIAGLSGQQTFGLFARINTTSGDPLTLGGVTYNSGLNTAIQFSTRSDPGVGYEAGLGTTAISTNQGITFDATIPITQWALSGTMNVLQEENLTQWKSYTPTFNNNAVNSADFRWRRVGENMEVTGYGVWNGAGGLFEASIPAGYTVDTAQYDIGSITPLGNATVFQSPFAVIGFPSLANATTLIMYTTYNVTSFSASGLNVTQQANLNNGDLFQFNASFKVVEFANAQNALVGFASATEGSLGLAGPAGKYTPNVTNSTNVAAFSVTDLMYVRTGKVVHVTGRVDITPASGGGTQTSLFLDLPIPSNIINDSDLWGVATTNNGTQNHGAIVANDATNNWAEIRFPSEVTTNCAFGISFMYFIN